MQVRPQHLAASIALPAGLLVAALIVGPMHGADEPAPLTPAATMQKYCFQCHSKAAAMGGISLDQLMSRHSVGQDFKQWQKVIAVLDERRMPPKGMPQPADAERSHTVAWVRSEFAAFNKDHAGDPGRVTVRRLTSGEYAYAVRDLTGIDIDTEIDAATDSVGGEGFTNFGDVQFMQDAALERYLASAKKIAEHAVIGAGPLGFYSDPGNTGFEFSAITRIKDIYERNGYRTVSGEGGIPFGLDRVSKAFYVAWRYQHRAAFGEPNAQLEALAAREGINGRFARHTWTVVNAKGLGYPTSEVAARFHKLPAPVKDLKASESKARAASEELQKFVITWPLWLFARGDAAVGGAGDESPLIINDKSLKVNPKNHFAFNRIARRALGPTVEEPLLNPTKVFLNVATVTPGSPGKPVVVWKNATIAYRKGGEPPPPPSAGAGAPAGPNAVANAPKGIAFGPKQSLRSVVTAETAKRLGFGESLDGSTVGPDDFSSELSAVVEVPIPQGVTGFQLQVDAELGSSREHVLRIVITDRENGSSRGIPVRKLIGDPTTAGYKAFKEGVLEFARLLPPNAQGEATPADKDPIPEPFDSTYNVPEHDDFDTRVKYIRDDRFLYENVLDDATRVRLDQAWNDLFASFEYHDNYMDIVAKHYKLDLHGKHIGDMSMADIEALPEEPRKYIVPLKVQHDAVVAAQAAARPKRLDDCLQFAALAWRRPLTESEKRELRSFYDRMLSADPDYKKAIRAVLTRILISPAFLYRVEQTADATGPAVKAVTAYETASRLSFFLWSSIPDEELRRAAAANELATPDQLRRQVKRMLADPKARRLSTEFFGQWLGFYHFDQFRGVDTSRFPEFKDDVRNAMYDEAISFFEYIVRNNRPALEMLTADYTFLSKPLADFYGVKRDIKSLDRAEKIEDANALGRGGLLRLGAVLTVTSAPLRTSPVKRGDWVLRRLLNAGTPPPPADAGSIPADDKMFGGLSLRDKLEAHKRNATCATCHVRIDPLGFPLESYDSTGRVRQHYLDGKAIWDTGTLANKKEIVGVHGLLEYLKSNSEQVQRTLATKLLGYALGRAVQASDQPLIERMATAGPTVTFTDLATDIVLSKQFRNRVGRGDDAVVASNSNKAGGR